MLSDTHPEELVVLLEKVAHFMKRQAAEKKSSGPNKELPLRVGA